MSSTNQPRVVSPKSGMGAFLLCLFAGVLGVHRFCVGKFGTGLLMLLTAGGFGFWMAYDLVAIVTAQFTDSEGRYLEINRTPETFHKAVKLLCALYTIFFLFIISVIVMVVLATGRLAAVGQAELTALRAADYDKAYSYTSTLFQKKISLDDFKKFVQSHDELQTNMSASFPNRELNNNDGFISGTLTMRDGSQTPIMIQFVYENNDWKIINIDLNR